MFTNSSLLIQISIVAFLSSVNRALGTHCVDEAEHKIPEKPFPEAPDKALEYAVSR